MGQVIALCRHHLAMEYDRNVVRALVAESSELNQFMSRLEDSDLLARDLYHPGQADLNQLGMSDLHPPGDTG